MTNFIPINGVVHSTKQSIGIKTVKTYNTLLECELRMNAMETHKKMHVVMYPWFGFGHLTPFLHLANKLAERGHKVSFFLPPKAQLKLSSNNHHPHLINFIPVTVPPVDGLPAGAETTADLPFTSQAPLLKAMDLTEPFIKSYLGSITPIDIVFYDYATWLPALAREHRAKAVYYVVGYASHFAYFNSRARGAPPGLALELNEDDLKHAPPGFPSSSLGFGLHTHEARGLKTLGFPGRIYFKGRICKAVEESDAICFKSCKEMEGEFGDFLGEIYKKPVLWAGVVPKIEESNESLDKNMEDWLKRFDPKSVVFCSFGSESVLDKDQFQQLALGLELTGLPFIAALKLPMACESLDSTLPQGFMERTKERGIIRCDWVQQALILKHPSIGCFVSHCGAGSLLEALLSDCELVLLPHRGDNFCNSRLMSVHLKVGLEIEREEEDGVFTKEEVCKAIMTVMDYKGDVGKEIRANHDKWRDFLLKEGLEESYITKLIENLQSLKG